MHDPGKIRALTIGGKRRDGARESLTRLARAAMGVAFLGCAGLSVAQTEPPLPETLSLEGRAALAAYAKQPPPPPATDLPARRAFFDKFQEEFGARQLQRYGGDVKSATMAGVPVRIIRPQNLLEKHNLILLNFHGGGFQVDTGSLTENIPIAALTRVPVVSVLYRMAPENAFPAALDDCLAVYRELLKTHESSEIGLYGTSAGAILGTELIARIRAEGLPEPAVLGVFSGDADLSRKGDSLATSKLDIWRLYRAYAGSTAVTEPSISPALGKVDFFPPTLCMASSRDFLLSSTSDFCRKLELSGVENKFVVFDGLPHGFWCFLNMPESDQAFAIMAKFLMSHLMPSHRRN